MRTTRVKVCLCVLVLPLILSSFSYGGLITSWDFATDFRTDSNPVKDWNYLAGEAADDFLSPTPTLMAFKSTSLNRWRADNGTDGSIDGTAWIGAGQMHAFSDLNTDMVPYLQWVSPVDQNVNVSITIPKLTNGQPDYQAKVYLNTTLVSTSSLVDGSLSYTINNLPVSFGSKITLMLQEGVASDTPTVSPTFTIKTVPEPVTVAMLGSGLVCLAARKRKAAV